MINHTLISIIIPIYNIEKYIRRCVESILSQTYSNLEIILVDDGSTDDSGIICDEYAKCDSRIIVIHKENGGLVSARKAGLEVASGAYIGNVDGDDWIDSCMYEELLANIGDADFVHTGFWIGDSDYISFKKSTISSAELKVQCIKNFIAGGRKNGLTASVWSKLFKASVFRDCYEKVPDSQSYGEDFLCVLQALIISEKIVLYPKAYYHYRVRDNSISHNASTTSIQQEIQLYNCLLNFAKEELFFDKYEYEINVFLARHVAVGIKKSANPFILEQYNFPQEELLENKRIVIYGAGVIGKNYYSQISRNKKISICGWIDNNYGFFIQSTEISAVESIFDMEYDVILIAVLNEEIALKIIDSLVLRGVSRTKILWQQPKDYLII